MNTPRIMLAAFASGSGKTTVTCALLQALVNKNLKSAAFKCGPDYIDPMFHSQIIGVPCCNLDVFMLGEDIVLSLLVKNSNQADIAVLEGVMGYYDGLYGVSTYASSYHVADITKTPVVLVVNGGGTFLSLAALIKGFAAFKTDSHIKAVILNNISSKSYNMYKTIIEEVSGLPVLGYLPKLPQAIFDSRHLGLVTAAEVKDLKEKMNILAQNAQEYIDIDAFLKIAAQAAPIETTYIAAAKVAEVTIAIACDKAFSFYYADGLDVLKEMGAVLVPFSPLADKKLPLCNGLILGGGYPELYAKILQDNISLRQDILQKYLDGLPIYAECGGFMYLLDSLKQKDGAVFNMCGVIKGQSFMTDSLKRMGYATVTCQQDNILCCKNMAVKAHEFHCSDSTNNGNVFMAQKNNGQSWPCIHANGQIFAGYPHFHFSGAPILAQNFIKACAAINK
ncbi:MAG: cobyrinate a,c-diamide synthase [Chloroflexi bacterium]|nr:cobyrinate a,c-diamide synthase [Chloroflexota bacterium]